MKVRTGAMLAIVGLVLYLLARTTGIVLVQLSQRGILEIDYEIFGALMTGCDCCGVTLLVFPMMLFAFSVMGKGDAIDQAAEASGGE